MAAVAIHHEEHGPAGAPVLVLASSLGTSCAMWDAQLARVADQLRVVRYDHRGHGRSPVPPGPYALEELAFDVLALLDRLELERVSFCGLSLGGMVGLWLAAHAPERVERLVVCASSAHMPPASNWTERAAAVRAAETVAAISDAVLERWLTPGFAASRPEVAARLRAMLEGTPKEGYAGGCEAIAVLDLRPALASIRAPTLVIAGREDPAAPPEAHGRVIAEAISGARLEVLSPAAHLLCVEQPERANDLILDHVIPKGG
jgi:3-oxoadipate enol-lactonase